MTEDLRGRDLGGFVLREPLGSGAFATVWRARQPRLDRDVAVKVLDPRIARDPDAARRFEREGRAAASLEHPNIVPVFGAGETDGLVWLAMRLVEGPTLAAVLATEGPLSQARTARLLVPVAAALDHAHRRGLIHRDVKPSNILMEEDRVWLADFGIAALARDAGRYTAGAIGTAAYMAPEQARPGDLDHRADVYALGCVAFECLRGQPPFETDDLVATLLAHASEPIPVIGDVELDRFFARALAKDRGERFQSAGDLMVAFRGLAAATVDVAPPSATLEGSTSGAAAARSPRRRWWPAAVALAVLALAGAGAALLRDGADDRREPAATDDAAAVEPVLTTDGAVVVALTGVGISTPNPHVDLGAEGLTSGNVLPPLYVHDDVDGWQPHLAAGDPEIVQASPLRVRWRLRADAVWDDGSPIVAGDVVRTWDYITDPASGATAAGLHARIADLTVDDERTFTATFDEPVGEPRVLFSTFHPVIKAAALDAHLAAGGDPGRFLADGIDFSGGPFRLSSFDPGTEVRLVRNERWWGEPAKLQRATIRLVDSGAAAVGSVDSGDADVAVLVTPQATDVVRAGEVDDAEVRVVPGPTTFGLQFNLAAPPLGDPRVRQAILRALDREAMRDAVAVGVTTEAAPPGSLVFLPGQEGYVDHLSAVTRDTDAAARLLDESGLVPDGAGRRTLDGRALSLELIYPTGATESARLTALSLLLVEQLGAVGLDVVARPVDSSELASVWMSGAFELSLSISRESPDPMAAVARYSGERCPATVPGCNGDPAGLNFWSYANPTVTELLERTETTVDPAARLELFEQADAVLSQDLPAIPIVQPSVMVVADERVQAIGGVNLRAGPLSGLPAWGFLAS